MTGPRPEEPAGVSEEARRLVEAVEAWARSASADGTGASIFAGLDGHVATGAPECTLCPVCQLLRTLGAVRPETVEHVLDAVTALAAAFRSLAPAPRPSGSSRVEHIDVAGE